MAEFDEEFAELAGLAYRVGYRLLGDREEARDIAQETLARAYLRWRRIEGHARAWVGRVSSNLALDVVRRRARPEPHHDHDTGDPNDLTAERLQLVAALSALPRRQRQAVVLRYLADLPEKQVAEELGCSVGSVKSAASRGLAALRESLSVPVPIAPLAEEM